MTDSRALTAVGILLGGSSRRMGTPKHELQLTGESTLLDRMLAIAGALSETIVLCGDGAADHACPRVEDRPGSIGPLAGIEALLHHVNEGRCLILPCDMPGLEVDDLQRLAASSADLAIFATTGAEKMRCLPMMIDASKLPALKQAMDEHAGALWAFIQSQPHERISPPKNERTLNNLNTPEELEACITLDSGRSSR